MCSADLFSISLPNVLMNWYNAKLSLLFIMNLYIRSHITNG